MGSLKNYDCLILTTKTEMEEENDEWKGFVQTLKKFISGQTKQIQASQDEASLRIESITNS
jgi:flavodoxin